MPTWIDAGFFYGSAISFMACASIMLANRALDNGWPNWRSRKIAHVGGGLCYLLMFWLLNAGTALTLSVLVTAALITLRWRKPHWIRGIGGSARPHAYAELTYPIATTLALGVGWVWLGNKPLALLPILFVAFGDAATGLVRSFFATKEAKLWQGSVAMAIVCIPMGVIFYPVWWIGLAGAVMAVVAEAKTGLARGWIDDNPVIVAGSFAVMAVLATLPAR